MPNIIVGDQFSSSFDSREKFDYSYPRGLDLSPQSPLHRKLKENLMRSARESARIMSRRFPAWNVVDHTLTAYIPIDEAEGKIKRKDFRKPVSIVFPYSYTVLETLLAFYTAAFLQEPIFRYEGVGPDDVIGGILLEKLIALQTIKNKVGLSLHTMARDAFSYGIGVVTPIWVKEYGSKTVRENISSFMGLRNKIKTTIKKDQLLFEGNALENIDPYLYLPDPSVPIHEPQKGNYSGWIAQTNYNDLLTEEQHLDGETFNVKYLEKLKRRNSSIYSSDDSGRGTKTGISNRDGLQLNDTNSIFRLKMFKKIIPSELGLGSSNYPEPWYFELAQDEIIIKAKPIGLDHNKFPISVIVPDYDGYSLSPVSRIEMLNGMQGVLDFMFNSHVENVRQAINDKIIYDPFLVNGEDLKNPSAGKLIRLRRPAWGLKSPRDVATQLAVSDVTRANVSDSTWIVQWMDRISGTDSSMQGALRQGGPERLTGVEYQGTRAGGINRLERIAKVVGMQGMQDIGTFFGHHNQQLMTAEAYVKLSGDWQDLLIKEYGDTISRGRIKVDPLDVNINYNVIVRDGSIPGGNYADTWIKLYQILSQNPQLAQNFDMVRIFLHIAQNLGAKDVNSFVKRGGNVNPQIMPNAQVMDQAKQGNIIPFNPQQPTQQETQ